MDPWPNSVEGVRRLKTRFPIGPLANGDIAGMLNLARFASRRWDLIAGAEITKSYKPVPGTYTGSARAVGLEPAQVAMVAAHNQDLQAAKAAGRRTVFILRPHEQDQSRQPTLPLRASTDSGGATETAPSGRS